MFLSSDEITKLCVLAASRGPHCYEHGLYGYGREALEKNFIQLAPYINILVYENEEIPIYVQVLYSYLETSHKKWLLDTLHLFVMLLNKDEGRKYHYAFLPLKMVSKHSHDIWLSHQRTSEWLEKCEKMEKKLKMD